jgi:hypothetical protein
MSVTPLGRDTGTYLAAALSDMGRDQAAASEQPRTSSAWWRTTGAPDRRFPTLGRRAQPAASCTSV